MKLAFIGFGELGHYLKDTLREVHAFDEEDIVYFDDNLLRAGAAHAHAFADHELDTFAAHHFYIALGYQHLRVKHRIVTRLVELGRTVPPFVHPSSYVHPTARLGPGAFVYPGCSVDRGVVLGASAVIANADVIPHDCIIGDACWFGASVTLSGKVTVGQRTFIGSGSTISNDIRIGSDVVVGLATAVTRNVDDGRSVIGNPMRVLDRPIQLV